MNWKRIIAFVALQFAATASAGFVIGIINSFGEPSLVGRLVQALVVLASAAMVFAVLAGRQSTRTWEHAWTVAFVTWCLSYPLNVLTLAQPTKQWAGGGIALCLAVFAGVPCGRYFRITSRSNPPTQ
jgi:hypothetical protein